MGDAVDTTSANGRTLGSQPDIVGKPPVLTVEDFSKSFGVRVSHDGGH